MERFEPTEGSTHRKRKYSVEEVVSRIHRYCAYQERSHREVREKLFEYGISSDQVDELITTLITGGFLNEERFAKAYAGGKFRIKRWGRLKIRRELEQKGLTTRCIDTGIKEIDNAEYIDTLKELLTKRAEQSTENDLFIKRDKIARFAISKGYEPEIVWEQLKLILPDRPRK